MTVHPLRFMLVSGLALTALVLIAALAAVQIGSAMERTLIVFFVSLTAVAGMGLYSGNSGILSFGHLAFMGIAA